MAISSHHDACVLVYENGVYENTLHFNIYKFATAVIYCVALALYMH